MLAMQLGFEGCMVVMLRWKYNVIACLATIGRFSFGSTMLEHFNRQNLLRL
jgi:hypothetical protein